MADYSLILLASLPRRFSSPLRNLPEGSTVDAFLEATVYAGEMIACDQVRAAWQEPSRLPLMNVGDVASHLFLVLRRVGKHLETDSPLPPRPPGGTVTSAWNWLHVRGVEDLDQPAHQRVRLDASHVAGWGWASVHDAYQERTTEVAGLLRRGCPTVLALPGIQISFPTYLATRIVEMLVHADDLGCSIGRLMPIPAQPLDIAIELLVDGARSAYGDLPVLRALSRPERAPTSISVL